MAHLSDDETVAKMGHPVLDVGHPTGQEARECEYQPEGPSFDGVDVAITLR